MIQLHTFAFPNINKSKTFCICICCWVDGGMFSCWSISCRKALKIWTERQWVQLGKIYWQIHSSWLIPLILARHRARCFHVYYYISIYFSIACLSHLGIVPFSSHFQQKPRPRRHHPTPGMGETWELWDFEWSHQPQELWSMTTVW